MTAGSPGSPNGHRPRARRVLHTLRARGGSSFYAALVLDAPPPGYEQLTFTWSRALLGRYDVLHAHWPEQLVRDTRRPFLLFLRRRMLDLLLLRLRLQRIPLVWTAHNTAPHESGTMAEQRALSRFTRSVDTTVKLTAASPVAVGHHQRVIPHSHYREHHRRALPPGREFTRTSGRLLYFGIIRRYKGVDTLLAAFRRTDDPEVSLRVAGHPHAGQAEPVLAACAADSRITCYLEYLDDAEIVAEVLSAQLVVLPYRGTMHNSGTLLAALSLDRPVLVPRSPTNTALSDEVGPGWVLQYDGELDEHVLLDALAATTTLPSQPPDLSAHDPARVALLHRDVYDEAVAAASGHRKGGR